LRELHFCADRYESSVGQVEEERLTVRQTATSYWVVQRGSVHLAGALTRKAAEAERELRERLRKRRPPARRRASPPDARVKHPASSSEDSSAVLLRAPVCVLGSRGLDLPEGEIDYG
jgi:hypothetical protein